MDAGSLLIASYRSSGRASVLVFSRCHKRRVPPPPPPTAGPHRPSRRAGRGRQEMHEIEIGLRLRLFPFLAEAASAASPRRQPLPLAATVCTRSVAAGPRRPSCRVVLCILPAL